MNKVLVVSGYVPLQVKHLDTAAYRALGDQLKQACNKACIPYHIFEDYPYEKCWLAQDNPPMVGANARATDRFDTDEQHAKSNVVCNQFVQWAWEAYKKHPKVDVIVWFVYSLLRQGDFTGNRITQAHIIDFLHKVQHYKFKDIPFPGISEDRTVNVHGDNWRFCGSTHIWPTKWLKQIRKEYQQCARAFVSQVKATPLDLQVWPTVEAYSDLPFRWYKAEYDTTQLTNFPGSHDRPM